MTADPLRRLRQEATRGDYASMARWARALYESGLDTRAVIRTCYGIDFPEEFFVIAEAGALRDRLRVLFTEQPWELAVPLDQGGPSPVGDGDGRERKVYARDPDLVPLAYLGTGGWDETIACYRLSELAQGRSTMFGVPRRAEPRDEVTPLGGHDSLLSALREYQAAHLEYLDWRTRQPSNRGAGAVGEDEVRRARFSLDLVETWQREVASRAER